MSRSAGGRHLPQAAGWRHLLGSHHHSREWGSARESLGPLGPPESGGSAAVPVAWAGYSGWRIGVWVKLCLLWWLGFAVMGFVLTFFLLLPYDFVFCLW
jgi:hypothetical protein